MKTAVGFLLPRSVPSGPGQAMGEVARASVTEGVAAGAGSPVRGATPSVGFAATSPTPAA
jgi:hypothetical protein